MFYFQAGHFEEHPLVTFEAWIVVPPAERIKIVYHKISNISDRSCWLKCLHHQAGKHRSAYHVQHHFQSVWVAIVGLIFKCIIIAWLIYDSHSAEVKLENVVIHPLIPPQLILLDGQTSQQLSSSADPQTKKLVNIGASKWLIVTDVDSLAIDMVYEPRSMGIARQLAWVKLRQVSSMWSGLTNHPALQMIEYWVLF